MSKSIELKILVGGGESVGKTNLVYRIVENKFEEEKGTSINADSLQVTKEINGHSVILNVFDLPPITAVNQATATLFKNVSIFFIVAACDDRESLEEHVRGYYSSLDRYGETTNTITYLLNNKIDIDEGDKTYNEDDVKSIAEKVGIKYFNISCKTGDGIQEVLEKAIIEKCPEINEQTENKKQSKKKEKKEKSGDKSEKKKKGCVLF